jgi:hypothetical protein
MDNYFTKLNSINVSEHLEKKGQFAYLSWPYAVAHCGRLIRPRHGTSSALTAYPSSKPTAAILSRSR